ncbi:MAG: SDR family oxidoreductase [Planctomycetes bacterium]|nr:SDR family oxidoreductase [Planctomycetota bacterium]
MPRTVVTGGAGFIGSHLCEHFVAQGHEVICIDNLLTGSRDNVAHLERDERFRFRLHDVTTYIDVPGPVDNVLHFASPASPADFERLPIQIMKVGAHGTHNALGLAKAKKARFLLASTSEVYGDPEVNPQPESYLGRVNCIGIRGVYDEAKRFAEALTMAYRRVHGVETRIVRIFNTYGPRMQLDDGRALPNFITQALTGEPLTVYGDGSQTRSFGFVSDLVDGIDRLLRSDIWEPVNIGNPEEITLLQAAREVLELTGSRSELVFRPLPPGDPKVRRPDITRARDLLGWTPTVARRVGYQRTIDDFRARLEVKGLLRGA